MSWQQPPYNQLVNFLAASRKAALISSGYFSPNDNVSFIWAPSTTGVGTSTPLTGTINGVNLVFTSPITVVQGIMVYLNGVYQDPTSSYALSGNTVIFATAPQIGDDVNAVVS
jgi:hypothetical protein